MRDWTANVENTYYLIGSAMGPHPYPTMVRDFQKIIGEETKRQLEAMEHTLPDCVVACVGGGSNAIGMFYDFIPNETVRLIGAESRRSWCGYRFTCGHHGKRLQRNFPWYEIFIPPK